VVRVIPLIWGRLGTIIGYTLYNNIKIELRLCTLVDLSIIIFKIKDIKD